MSPDDEMTPAAFAAAGFEIAVLLCGAWMIWRHVLSRRGREESQPRLAGWTLPGVDFACLLAFAFLGPAIAGALMGYLLPPSRLGSDAALVATSAAMHAGILLGIASFYLVFGQRVRGPAPAAPAPSAFKSGVLTFLVAMPLVLGTSYAWEFILSKMGWPEEQQELVDILENTHSLALKLLLLSVATLVVPVTEEVVFRAGLFRYFRTRAPRWSAIVVTSALFAALHLSYDKHLVGLPSLAPLFVLAVVFCLAYERTGNIGTTIVAHSLFNLNMFILIVAGIGS